MLFWKFLIIWPESTLWQEGMVDEAGEKPGLVRGQSKTGRKSMASHNPLLKPITLSPLNRPLTHRPLGAIGPHRSIAQLQQFPPQANGIHCSASSYTKKKDNHAVLKK